MSKNIDEVAAALDRAFAAQHDGRCVACQEAFETGEMIVMMQSQTIHASQDCIATVLDV